MNKIFIPAITPEDWKLLLADPEKHWKLGCSAKALAYCWHNANGFPEGVNKGKGLIICIIFKTSLKSR